MKKIQLVILLFFAVLIMISCGGEDADDCGNFYIDSSEECDGGYKDCGLLITGTRGDAYCRYDCSGYDTSTCREPYCGDEILDSGEECDSDYKECSSMVTGTKGSAYCKSNCSGYDTSTCRVPVCGDNEIDPGEECDGNSELCEVLDASYYGNAPCNDSCDGYITDSCQKFQEFSFGLTDKCDDGENIQFRLFQFNSSEDSNYDRFWPEDPTHVYITNGLNQEGIVTIACEKDNLICYGGTPEETAGYYWGVGISGDMGCEGCCVTCVDGGEKSVDLICGSGEVTSCTKNSDCTANDVCRKNKCVSPLGLNWTISANSMTFNSAMPDGSSWDALGGAPDIAAQVGKNEELLFQTTEVSDSYSASWSNASKTTTVNIGDSLQFCAADIDLSEDDVVGCVSVTGNGVAQILKQGSFTEKDFKITGVSSFRFTFIIYN